MKSNVKFGSLVVFTVAVILAIVFHGNFRSHADSPMATIAPCIASADVQCPNQEFVNQIQTLKALTTEINACINNSSKSDNCAKLQDDPRFLTLQAKQDELSGLSSRLAGMLPRGFQWDDAKQELTRVPVSPAAPPALAPAKSKP